MEVQDPQLPVLGSWECLWRLTSPSADHTPGQSASPSFRLAYSCGPSQRHGCPVSWLLVLQVARERTLPRVRTRDRNAPRRQDPVGGKRNSVHRLPPVPQSVCTASVWKMGDIHVRLLMPRDVEVLLHIYIPYTSIHIYTHS